MNLVFILYIKFFVLKSSYGDSMKKIWKNNSKLLIIVTILEIILSIYFLMYFSYMDKLSYVENSNNLSLLVQNMYTSTWWALIIMSISLISIFSITSIVYKKNYLHFISILIWGVLFILSLDLEKSLKYNISNMCIFIPIIVINILAYFKEKKYLK